MSATDITDNDLDAQVEAERAHLAAAREALRRMRERAQHLHATGAAVAGDRYGAESLGVALRSRIKALADDPTTPIFFGRLTFAPDASKGTLLTPSVEQGALPNTGATGEGAETFHIGRRHVTDDAGEPMVLDWRAPISRLFYQASAADPQGVTVRRRFGFAAGTLTGFEDEHLDRGEQLGTASAILTTEIERPRVGPMRDIVATIQPDQDLLVRAELAESVCVQGAPGTGKTAVGLHRAAYLLYAHRERLRRNGVLVIGPNRGFLAYIGAVLPALGEVEVQQSTVDDLVSRVAVRGQDTPEVAVLKHDARMATVLARALSATIRRPTEELVVTDGSWRWRVGLEVLRRIVDDVRREAPAHGTGRERVQERVIALLQRQAEARRGDSPPESWLRAMRRNPAVRALLDQVWPVVTPESLVFSVLAEPAVLAAAAEGVLTAEEQETLRWHRPPRTVKAARWSAADAFLIDEAAGLIERPPSFGHIVVDEAQDLSPMQCRAIARRCEHGSLTVLGDLAQGTAPWATTSWEATLTHLGKPDGRVVPLTTGFRVPAPVLELANRLLPALDVDVPAAVSLRHDGLLDLRRVEDVTASTVDAVRSALSFEGSIAVICADASAARLLTALREAGIVVHSPVDGDDPAAADESADNQAEATDARVTLMPASLAKGLEYDHVVLTEPAEIVAAEPRGLHRLYVVLTRAVSRLVVVHTQPLPMEAPPW